MILTYPNDVLKAMSAPFSKVTGELKATIDELEKELTASDIGVGLAAPQIGVNKRIFAIKEETVKNEGNEKKTVIHFFVNPQITDTFEQQKTYVALADGNNQKEPFLEGCLSVPKVWGSVKRWTKIKAKWQEIEEEQLKDKEGILQGIMAIVFQHELDHLDGILFIDHIRKDNGKLYLVEDDNKTEISFNELTNLGSLIKSK